MASSANHTGAAMWPNIQRSLMDAHHGLCQLVDEVDAKENECELYRKEVSAEKARCAESNEIIKKQACEIQALKKLLSSMGGETNFVPREHGNRSEGQYLSGNVLAPGDPRSRASMASLSRASLVTEVEGQCLHMFHLVRQWAYQYTSHHTPGDRITYEFERFHYRVCISYKAFELRCNPDVRYQTVARYLIEVITRTAWKKDTMVEFDKSELARRKLANVRERLQQHLSHEERAALTFLQNEAGAVMRAHPQFPNFARRKAFQLAGHCLYELGGLVRKPSQGPSDLTRLMVKAVIMGANFLCLPCSLRFDFPAAGLKKLIPTTVISCDSRVADPSLPSPHGPYAIKMTVMPVVTLVDYATESITPRMVTKAEVLLWQPGAGRAHMSERKGHKVRQMKGVKGVGRSAGAPGSTYYVATGTSRAERESAGAKHSGITGMDGRPCAVNRSSSYVCGITGHGQERTNDSENASHNGHGADTPITNPYPAMLSDSAQYTPHASMMPHCNRI